MNRNTVGTSGSSRLILLQHSDSKYIIVGSSQMVLPMRSQSRVKVIIFMAVHFAHNALTVDSAGSLDWSCASSRSSLQ